MRKENNTIVSEMYKVATLSLHYDIKIKASERYKISNSSDINFILRKYAYSDDTIELKEYFTIVTLNNNLKVLGVYKVSDGGLDTCAVDVKDVLRVALLSNARCIAISHNHPSGVLKPSIQDDKITNDINNACKLFNIRLLDHVIVTDETYYSYSDNGRL